MLAAAEHPTTSGPVSLALGSDGSTKKQIREVIMTQSVTMDDDESSGSDADCSNLRLPPKSPNRVVIVVVRRDQKNNSMGVGLIP